MLTDIQNLHMLTGIKYMHILAGILMHTHRCTYIHMLTGIPMHADPEIIRLVKKRSHSRKVTYTQVCMHVRMYVCMYGRGEVIQGK